MQRSTDHFIVHDNDSRLLYEKNGKSLADLLLPFVSESILTVESIHQREFALPVKIYICGTEESFYKYYGAKTVAGVSNKLIISPRLLKEIDHIENYLTHELSHLHLYQQLGLLNFRKLPFWFKEGLATFVSGGGGAEKVTEAESIESIKNGKHFVPHFRASLFSQKSAFNWGLSHHMMYRQNMMFISFLKSKNEKSFNNFLLSIQNNEYFKDAFEKSFDESPDDLWKSFLFTIRNKG